MFSPHAQLSVNSDVIEAEGVVVEMLPNAKFRVKLTEGPFPEDHEITARPGGKLKKYSIRIILGDLVTVEVSPYDLTQGRITFRKG